MRAAKRLIKRQNDRKRKLADAGIKYDFEAVSYVSLVPIPFTSMPLLNTRSVIQKKVKEAEV